MKILKFTAENIKKLKVVSITPQGSIVEITGPNGSGKSSVLDSIYYALAGAKDIPSQPIRRGQLKAHVTLELGEITVIRKFSKDTGTTLIVEAKNGARFQSPQKMLDELLGKLTFDPLEFSRMDAKKQLDQIRSMVKLEIDVDEIDRKNADAFTRRTDLNREIKQLDARGHGIQVPADTPDEELDVAKLVEELQAAGQHNADAERVKNMRERLVGEADRELVRARESRDRAAALRKQADQADAEAKTLEESVHAKRNQAQAIAVPEAIETAEIVTLIDQAHAINAAVAEKTRQTKIFAEAKKLRGEVEALEEEMAARTRQKREAIAAASMPIEGLSFGDGEVTFNGLPFAQASSAEQLRISVAIAMAANPKLRVLRIADGSLLDESGMEMISQMADLADYQIWIERVDTSGKVGIVMEDGHVKGSEVEAAK